MYLTADMGFLWFFAHLLLFHRAFASEGQYAATIGEDVTLQCRAPRDAVVTVLEWSKPDLSVDDYVFFYRNERSYEKYQHSSFRGRVTLREAFMKDGDVSIVLKNVTVSDAGRYKCRIIMSNAASSERVLSEERSLSVTEAEHTDEVSEPVGRVGKAFQRNENHQGGQSVAVGVGVGLDFVSLFLLLLFVC
ncbi:V-set domain-containing T-cell activation inhibitor 1-like [Simochromis diagramma]|uniref:V-set domain-containing T-cell activation inhibitor 1-like n=1 Tax=Simochromis diagramma TaxID=43689 RepID=UPI001A7EF2A3|nr:V-set domain-containing T-cell activation inhibitor 1-like [Simochromis diagramma]XP_039869427.1 V-set domain-containing T-cell activation inhibitor 1-like [Simochromis diagramma]